MKYISNDKKKIVKNVAFCFLGFFCHSYIIEINQSHTTCGVKDIKKDNRNCKPFVKYVKKKKKEPRKFNHINR